MNGFDILKTYFLSMQEQVNYGCHIARDNFVTLKNYGAYVQIMFPSSSVVGHDKYDIYFDDSKQLIRVTGYTGNAGFANTKYY